MTSADEGLELDAAKLGLSVLKFGGEKLLGAAFGAVFSQVSVWAGIGGGSRTRRS